MASPKRIWTENFTWEELGMVLSPDSLQIGNSPLLLFLILSDPPLPCENCLAAFEKFTVALLESSMYSFLVLIGRYLHIQEREQSNWLRERLETPNPWTFTTEEKVRVLDGL